MTVNEICEGCSHLHCDEYRMYTCLADTEPVYDEEYESWECECYEDAEEIYLRALDREYERLEEMGKNKAKGVYD